MYHYDQNISDSVLEAKRISRGTSHITGKNSVAFYGGLLGTVATIVFTMGADNKVYANVYNGLNTIVLENAPATHAISFLKKELNP